MKSGPLWGIAVGLCVALVVAEAQQPAKPLLGYAVGYDDTLYEIYKSHEDDNITRHWSLTRVTVGRDSVFFDGYNEIWRMDKATGEISALPNVDKEDAKWAIDLDVSPSGRVLFIVEGGYEENVRLIRRYDLVGGVMMPETHKAKVVGRSTAVDDDRFLFLTASSLVLVDLRDGSEVKVPAHCDGFVTRNSDGSFVECCSSGWPRYASPCFLAPSLEDRLADNVTRFQVHYGDAVVSLTAGEVRDGVLYFVGREAHPEVAYSGLFEWTIDRASAQNVGADKKTKRQYIERGFPYKDFALDTVVDH